MFFITYNVSDMVHINAGVPQGCILGPSCFSVYSDDFPKFCAPKADYCLSACIKSTIEEKAVMKICYLCNSCLHLGLQ